MNRIRLAAQIAQEDGAATGRAEDQADGELLHAILLRQPLLDHRRDIVGIEGCCAGCLDGNPFPVAGGTVAGQEVDCLDCAFFVVSNRTATCAAVEKLKQILAGQDDGSDLYEMVEKLSPIRHLDCLRAPLIVAYGTYETPEFQRQARDFAGAFEQVDCILPPTAPSPV